MITSYFSPASSSNRNSTSSNNNTNNNDSNTNNDNSPLNSSSNDRRIVATYGSPSSRPNNPNEKCEGFDPHLGRLWIYPSNMSTRGYQKQAVEKALFTNAMIVLPTGFGKTFIAAVVMHNFFRWYPEGKIIFVAPTRPLVAQQIVECKRISGIPSSDCIEITGMINSEKRKVHWDTKRVFFATPQVIENDLESSILPAERVKCLVIDEAHKAQGGYAYVNIVKKLQTLNKDKFRILALSATPGSDIQRVQQVIQNLYIGDVMFRSENSIDLMQFKNEKSAKAWTVELTGQHKQFVNSYIEMTKSVIKPLYQAGLTFSADSIDRVAKYTLIKAMNDIKNNNVDARATSKGSLMFLASSAISLAHNFELLVLYGIRVFYASMQRNIEDKKNGIRTILASKVEFDVMMGEMKGMFGEDIEIDPTKPAKTDLSKGHPKLRVVKDLLLKHFETHKDKTDTRAMVFSKYRESVYDIVQSLQGLDPIIKPAVLVGQGSGPKGGTNGVGGLKQKEQIQVIRDYKDGKFNVLVATCVAEEGLDIGEIDLIICFDTTSSPISTTQRRGRTGRKRSGDVQTLLTKGYEEKRLKKAGTTRRQVEEQLFRRENYMQSLYKCAPRMVPSDVVPILMEQKIFPIADTTDSPPRRKRQRKSPEEPMKKPDDGPIKSKVIADTLTSDWSYSDSE